MVQSCFADPPRNPVIRRTLKTQWDKPGRNTTTPTFLVQVLVLAMEWRFKSSHPHQRFQEHRGRSNFRAAFVSARCNGRVNDFRGKIPPCHEARMVPARSLNAAKSGISPMGSTVGKFKSRLVPPTFTMPSD